MTIFTWGCQVTTETAVGHGQVADGEDPEPPSMADTGDSGDPGDDGGGAASLGFVPDDDTMSFSQCDEFRQDCEPGFKCMPYGSTGGNWDADKCVPVLGRGEPGDSCTYDGPIEGTDSCGAGSMCWGLHEVDGQFVGTCTPFCQGTADEPECPAGHSCSISCAGTVNLCIKGCDPIAQDCLGMGCYWAGNTFSCVFTTEDIELGEPCGYINDCKPGLACVTADIMPNCEGSACCGEFCDLREPVCDQAGTECYPWFEDGVAPPEYENVGICIIPGGW